MKAIHTKATVVLVMTPAEFNAARSLVGASNADGDHYDWMKSAGTSRESLRAIRSVTEWFRNENHGARLRGSK